MSTQLKTQVQEIGPNKVALTVEVGTEQVSAAYNHFFQRAAHSVKIPGFRPGKAPRPVLAKFIGPDAIREQVEEELVNQVYPDAIRQTKLHPVSDFSIEESNLKEGQPFTFKATFDVRPKLGEIGYRGHTVTVKRLEVDEELIGKVLEQRREQFSKTVPVEDGELQFGDYFMGKIVVSCDGAEDAEMSEEKGYHKFTEDNRMYLPMKGMKNGETRTFTYEANTDAEKDSKYFGKTLDVTVTLERISRPTLPALNDEFAKEVGEFSTLDELKAKIRKDLEEHSVKDGEERAVDAILKEVVGKTHVDLPNAMVERTIDYFVSNIDRRWRQFNSSLAEFLKRSNKDYKAFREEFREKAEFETKVMLIVDEIGEREKIEVSDAEFRAEVEKRASDYGMTVDKLMEHLSKGDGEENLRHTIRDRQIREFLLKNNAVHYDMVKEAEFNKGDNAQ